jgi:predicted membrane metal-binding protein
MDKRLTPMPVMSHRRGLLGAITAVCTGGLGFIVARWLFVAFHHAAPWVLPAVVVGTLALVMIFVLVGLPLISRRP